MEKIKALAVKQPFASGIALGEKTIEVRTWKTGYRGALLIVATGKDCKVDDFICPGGFALAVVNLIEVRTLKDSDLDAAVIDKMPSKPCFAWVFEGATEIEPFPASGKLRLFDVEPPFLRELPGDFEDHIDYFAIR